MRNPQTIEEQQAAAAVERGFDKLRDLLLRPEQEHLADIDARLLDPERLAEHVAKALPMAVRQGHKENSQLAQALAPIIESAIEQSIRRNPKLLSEILFPVIGRAVRRAVADAWQNLLQTLNQALESRLSPHGLKLRWLAWRSGRPYAELLLAEMVVYQVEQIFLIHKETGLLLCHLGGPAGETGTSEVVSSMLTAIQDFVRDSFKVEEDTPLESMQVGELQVWVEPGPQAYLAAVIRGHPGPELRATLKTAMEELQFELATDFRDFEGDTSPFEDADPILAGCMLRENREAKKGPLKLVFSLIALMLVAWLGWIGYGRYREQRDRSWIRERLAATPGYWLSDIRMTGGSYRLDGLSDPLAPGLDSVLAGAELVHPYQGHFQPFQSLEPSLLLTRCRRLLSPPPGVQLELDGDVLVLSGSAPSEWVDEVERRMIMMPAIASWHRDKLKVIIREQPAPDPAAVLTSWLLPFERDEARLGEEQRRQVEAILPVVETLLADAARQGRRLYLEVGGYSDNSGRPAYNQQISEERARSVVAFLVEKGIPQERLRAVGHGSSAGADGGARQVTLTVRDFASP